jgi:hypothetical protein
MQSANEVLDKYNSIIVEGVKNALRNKNLTGYGPSVASGDTINSIRGDVSNMTLTIYGKKSIGALIYGRKPTESTSAGSPTLLEVIKKWIDVKGITPDGISKDSLAFLITRKIHREGTTIFRKYQGNPSPLLDGVIDDALIQSIKKDLILSSIGIIKSDVLKSVPSNMIAK